ncbi:MAG: hypothetical protein ACOCP8_07835 [archaeon]
MTYKLIIEQNDINNHYYIHYFGKTKQKCHCEGLSCILGMNLDEFINIMISKFNGRRNNILFRTGFVNREDAERAKWWIENELIIKKLIGEKI